SMFTPEGLHPSQHSCPTRRSSDLGAAHQVQGGITQLVVGDHGINGTCFQGRFGALVGTASNPLDGVVHADQARQAHGTAETGVDAQLGFRQADLGALGHDTEVTGQTHFQTAAQRQTVNGGHGGNVQIFEGVENAVGFQAASDQFLFGQLERLNKFGDVGADDENVLATGDDDTLDAVVGLDLLDSRLELGEGRLIELVDRLALQIKPQLGDAVL